MQKSFARCVLVPNSWTHPSDVVFEKSPVAELGADNPMSKTCLSGRIGYTVVLKAIQIA